MVNKRGSNGFVDAAVVVLAGLLFFRTADVLTYFAPPLLNDMVGADISWLYAFTMAFFVEGVALAFHFDPRAHAHTPAKIVKWVLLGISALCQVYDGNIVTNTIAEMSGPMKVGFQWGVPLLPIFVVVLLFFVGKLPEIGDSVPLTVRVKNWLDNVQDTGIKNSLPSPKAIWRGGKKKSPVSVASLNYDVDTVKIINRLPNDEDIRLATEIGISPYRVCGDCGASVPLTETNCAVCGYKFAPMSKFLKVSKSNGNPK